MAMLRRRRKRDTPAPVNRAATDHQPSGIVPQEVPVGHSHRKLLWVGVRLAISAILLAVIISKANVRAFAHALAQCDPKFALLGLGIGCITVVLSSWQWQVLLQRQDIAISLSLASCLYFVGFAFGQLLPTSIGGDVAKAAYVARLSRQGVRAASATVMARIVGLLALFLTSLPVALVASLVVPGFGGQLFLTLLVLCGVFVGALALLLSSPTLLRQFGGQRLERSRLGRKVLELATTCASYRLQPQYAFRALLVSLLFYAASNSNFYAYGLALHLNSPFWFYWIAIPITSLVTMLPISINGYGVRAASFAAVFALMGEPAALAISLALAMEVQMLIFALVGGVVALAINRRLAQPAKVVTVLPALHISDTLADSYIAKE